MVDDGVEYQGPLISFVRCGNDDGSDEDDDDDEAEGGAACHGGGAGPSEPLALDALSELRLAPACEGTAGCERVDGIGAEEVAPAAGKIGKASRKKPVTG